MTFVKTFFFFEDFNPSIVSSYLVSIVYVSYIVIFIILLYLLYLFLLYFSFSNDYDFRLIETFYNSIVFVFTFCFIIEKYIFQYQNGKLWIKKIHVNVLEQKIYDSYFQSST